MNVFLIGYMGSGKSTVGKLLAKKLDFKFIDYDDFLEAKEGMTVAELFNVKGEVYFRKQEYIYLQDVINLDATVVAFGGGTPCYGHNMTTMLGAPDSIVIYLKANVQTLTERLKPELLQRPLIQHLKSDDELNEFIRKHLFERNFYYNQANYKVVIDDKSPSEIVSEIIDLLN